MKQPMDLQDGIGRDGNRSPIFTMAARAVSAPSSGNGCTLPAAHDPRERLDDRLFPQAVFDLRPKQLNRIVRRMGALVGPAVFVRPSAPRLDNVFSDLPLGELALARAHDRKEGVQEGDSSFARASRELRRDRLRGVRR